MKIPYKMEELIPIVAWLADKYTSKESTSIPYEKAQQLMGAVMYCIDEWQTAYKSEKDNISTNLTSPIKPSAREAYDMGYQMVIQKVKDSIALYNEILVDFDAYGNTCLEDTFIKGFPEFFKWYDARFEPQNTILTLDYPVSIDFSKVSGINAIYQYLTVIQKEQDFLHQIPRAQVIERLLLYHPGYEDLVENLLQMVLKE